MAQGNRALQHWNHWLADHFLGLSLLEIEQQHIAQLLAKQFGKHALLIGVPSQHQLMVPSTIPCHTLITPLIHTEKKSNTIECDLHELPILTGSIDVVMLPHTLEFVDYPRQLLAEACRVIKPEGLIVICGFNPCSLWGLWKKLSKQSFSWTTHFIQRSHIKNWLHLYDFELEKEISALQRPPINQPNLYNKLAFLEKVGDKLFPILGGLYIVVARAKVIPLTPIRLKWKQQLNNIRITSTITGHIARQSK